MSQVLALFMFWGSLAMLLYTYAGFPVLVALRGLIRPRPIKYGTKVPTVSMIIAAYNESGVITEKLDNTLQLDYPRERLEIIVASDGSDDDTNRLVAEYGAPEVRLLALPRQGKNQTLNCAVVEAGGEVLVFSDADSMLARDALRRLVAPLSDPEVGGVGGDYRYTRPSSEETGERTYWSFDRILKRLQSQGGSMTSATGQIYAMRRSLFVPLPPGVTDDFFASIQVPASHRRLVFEPRAIAQGPIAETAGAEFRRKVRVMTAGLRAVWLMRHLLDPREYGFFAVQLLSHKVLRRLMVLPLLAIALSSPLLWHRGRLYKVATLGQLALHGAALLGFFLRKTRIGRSKLLSLPLFFEMVNAAALVALYNLTKGERHDSWVPQRAGMERDRAG